MPTNMCLYLVKKCTEISRVMWHFSTYVQSTTYGQGVRTTANVGRDNFKQVEQT